MAAAACSSPKSRIYSEAEIGKTSTITIRSESGQRTVQVMEGASLHTGVTADVAAFAKKQIPLPVPMDLEVFELAKKELVSFAQTNFDKGLLEKLTANILPITFPMLVAQLKNCIVQFNQKIGKTSYEAAYVVPETSREWVTQLALKYGITPPRVLHAGRPDPNNSSETVAILDECSFSGSNITGCIRDLTQIFGRISQDHKLVLESLPSVKPTIRNIYVLMPFISSTAKKSLNAWSDFLKENGNINMTVITGSISIPSADSLLDEEEFERFEELYDPDTGAYALAFSEWKTPDDVSIPTQLLEGGYNGKFTSIPFHSRDVFVPYHS